MARMVPFPMLPTTSSAERRLYEGFLSQLPEENVVYHSVDGVTAGPRVPEEDEADFLVAHPVDGIVVVEVKGGGIRYDPETRRWEQAGRTGRHELAEDPFRQASGAMHSLIDILSAEPDWHRWRPVHGYGVAFPDGRYDRPAHPGAPVEMVIDRTHLDALHERVPRIMRHWSGRTRPRAFGAEGMDIVSRVLGYRVDVRTPLQLAFNEEDRKIVELSEQQGRVRAMLLHLRRAAVTGAAGSGKTVLAIEMARRLAMSGTPTLLTCFNRRLAKHLAAWTDGTPNLDVRHFRRLCYKTTREAGLALDVPNGQVAGDGSPYFDHELLYLLERAARTLGPRYDAIVVDEAQDFKQWWWPALLALHTDPDDGRLYVFADANQDLYGALADGDGDGSVPFPVPPEHRLPPLLENRRSTAAINSFVSVFSRGDESPVSRGPDGRPVEVLEYRDGDELARLLSIVMTNLVEDEHVPLEDIVLPTPSPAAKSALRARGGVDGFRFSDEPEPGALLAATVHAFKGLERPVVILAELGERHEDELEQFLYMGGSRARNHLIVLATEPVAARLRKLTGVAQP